MTAVLDIEQGSPEWHRARLGSLGASSLHEALAKTKTGWSASRANCMARLIVERLTNTPTETYQNAAMIAGIETEPLARIAYEFLTGNDVRQIGLAPHPTMAGTHASPDGMVDPEGLLEIKCPQPAQHLATLLGEPIAQKYQYQMMWQMRCCDRQWCDFVSFSPAFPEHLKIYVKRVSRDDALIASLEKDVREFLEEIDAKIAALNTRYGDGENIVKAALTKSLADEPIIMAG